MKVILTESRLRSIIKESLINILREDDEFFNIKNVYHVSAEDFDKFELIDSRFPYFFFSSKPIKLGEANKTYICDLAMHNPLVFNGAESWGYPLWLYLSDKNGQLIPEEEFTREKFDGYLDCPYEFWKRVYYDDEEYLTDQIPELVKSLNMEYDGVIIPNITEGDTGIDVDDYIVFSPEQIQIKSKK